MKPKSPASPATPQMTCPVCFRPIRLDAYGCMTLHGYRRPGYGETIGRCYAAGRFEPLEVSPEGTANLIEAVIAPNLARSESQLARIVADTVEAYIDPYRSRRASRYQTEVIVKVGRDDSLFPRMRHEAESQVKSDIYGLKCDLAFAQKMLRLHHPAHPLLGD